MADSLMTVACRRYPQSTAACFGEDETCRLFDELFLKINKAYEKIQSRIIGSPLVRLAYVDDLQLSRYIK